MLNKVSSRIKWILLICLIITAIVVCLTSCNSSSQEHAEESSNGESEAVDDVPSTSPESSVVLDIPEDFLDFQNYIGEDISLFGMEEGLDRYHDVGTSSLYGHSGTVRLDVGWDGRTIIYARLDFDEPLEKEEENNVSGKLEVLFGEAVAEKPRYGNWTNYSGLTGYDVRLDGDFVDIEWNEENREAYEDKNPNAGESNSNKIQNTQLPPAIGMTAAQVRASTWGEPSDINRTTTRYGVSEQWVYRSGSETKYIYLDDGIVTAIQE